MKKQAKLHHALISVVCMIALIFSTVVLLGAEPQIPLIFGCMIAGIVAIHLGYSWEEIVQSLIGGISKSLEAILILILIGALIGTWILSGTVPAMIYYGLQLISEKYFLFTAALFCLMISFAIGAWGTVGTVGLAFMGIGQALGIPAPMIAGCIISGAYCGEVISPLSDATNLAAAVIGKSVFDTTKKSMFLSLSVFAFAEAFYFFLGFQFPGSRQGAAADISLLMESLHDSFHITLPALLPLFLMILCIIIKFPAIPSMLVGILSGYVIAVIFQGASPEALLTVSYSGFVSQTGNGLLDQLLTAGGMMSMMNSISIILIAMAFGGLMQRTGQMSALISPIIRFFQRKEALNSLTAITCILTNLILPDQYLGISVPGQMYFEEYKKRGLSSLELSRPLLCGGAVTSPLIPWNTCGIYCFSILSVGPLSYMPYALFNLFLPIVLIFLNLLSAFLSKCHPLNRKKSYKTNIPTS